MKTTIITWGDWSRRCTPSRQSPAPPPAAFYAQSDRFRSIANAHNPWAASSADRDKCFRARFAEFCPKFKTTFQNYKWTSYINNIGRDERLSLPVAVDLQVERNALLLRDMAFRPRVYHLVRLFALLFLNLNDRLREIKNKFWEVNQNADNFPSKYYKLKRFS